MTRSMKRVSPRHGMLSLRTLMIIVVTSLCIGIFVVALLKILALLR